jgi:non-heme chloroperoxidase
MIPQFQPKTIQVNGVDLQYIEQGMGDAVVFVHGGNTDFRSWISQMQAFAQHYHVISYSRRYHFPNAGAEQASGYFAAEHRDDLAALMEALGLAPAHVVASSYGAYITLLVARARPELVRSLVLGEPPVPMLIGSDVSQGFMRDIEPIRQAFERGESEQAVRMFMDARVGPGGFDRFPAPARQMMLDNIPEFKLEVGTSPDQYFIAFRCDDAKAIYKPTLLVTGADSPVFLHQMTGELERCLPTTERAMIPHASHGMHNQNPQAYNETVLEFLTRH